MPYHEVPDCLIFQKNSFKSKFGMQDLNILIPLRKSLQHLVVGLRRRRQALARDHHYERVRPTFFAFQWKLFFCIHIMSRGSQP